MRSHTWYPARSADWTEEQLESDTWDRLVQRPGREHPEYRERLLDRPFATEAAHAGGRRGDAVDALDAGQPGRLGEDMRDEGVDVVVAAFDVDREALAVADIAHRPRDRVTRRQVDDGVTKADALYAAEEGHDFALHGVRGS